MITHHKFIIIITIITVTTTLFCKFMLAPAFISNSTINIISWSEAVIKAEFPFYRPESVKKNIFENYLFLY